MIDHTQRVELDIDHLKARRQGLLELVRLVGVRHAERVQVLGAAHLELGHARRLLDLDGSRILAARGVQEVLNFANLLRLRRRKTHIPSSVTSIHHHHHHRPPPRAR